jgi:predicted small lipoprotein YifL
MHTANRCARTGILAIVVAIAAAMSGCGVRGSLENPAKDSATATADSGQGKKEDEAPKPHKGFVLDGLIR